MSSIYVPLPSSVADLLVELALQEMRHPRQQAALLIVEGLRKRGLLPGQGPEPQYAARVEEAGDA